MDPPSPPQVSVRESAVVAPPPAPETALPLTFFDVYWLYSPPVERVFFYRLAPSNDDAILSNLRTSLAQALCLTPGTADRYELHYQPGDGVAFTVAKETSSGDPTYILFPMDHRARMKPDPVPDEYLGNCIGAALHVAPKDKLSADGRAYSF